MLAAEDKEDFPDELSGFVDLFWRGWQHQRRTSHKTAMCLISILIDRSQPQANLHRVELPSW